MGTSIHDHTFETHVYTENGSFVQDTKGESRGVLEKDSFLVFFLCVGTSIYIYMMLPLKVYTGNGTFVWNTKGKPPPPPPS